MAYDYVPRLTDVGMRGSRYYSVVPSPWNAHIVPLNYFPHDGHPGNCTSYCIGRWWEICSGDTSKMTGLLSERKTTGTWNAGAWYVCSPSLQAGTRSPQPGDIACWKKNANYEGHVAVVEEVHLDYCVMSQSEYGRSGQYFRKTTNYAKYDYTGDNPWNYYKRNNYVLQGFIRMNGVPSPPAIPDFDMPTEWVVRVGEGEYLSEEEELNNAVMGYVALMNADPTLTLEACCGILGNMYGEVTLNPGCLQEGRPSAGGLVGWDPLTKWSHEADIRGIPWTDGDGQCEWVLSDNYWSYVPQVGWVLYHNFWSPSLAGGMTYDEFKHSTNTPEHLAELFCYAYEKAGIPHMNRRTEAARKYYDFLQGMNFESAKKPYDEHMPVWMLAGNAKPKLIY